VRAALGLIVFGIHLAEVRVPMVAMTHARAAPSLGTEFNAFLFASIEEGASDAPLSVVSALARLDLDPWQEAAELTQLPRDTAVQRLVGLLTKLPGGDPAHSDSNPIAQRLIALLPGPAGPTSGSSQPGEGSGAPVHADLSMAMALFLLMSVVAMAASGLTGHQSPAPTGVAAVAAPAAGAALPIPSPSPKAQP
jgi:hypothetical protein